MAGNNNSERGNSDDIIIKLLSTLVIRLCRIISMIDQNLSSFELIIIDGSEQRIKAKSIDWN